MQKRAMHLVGDLPVCKLAQLCYQGAEFAELKSSRPIVVVSLEELKRLARRSLETESVQRIAELSHATFDA